MTRIALRTLATLVLAGTCLLMEACTHSSIQPTWTDSKPLTDFQYKMLIAIDQEKIYPWQASEYRIEGSAMVSFDYVDGGHAVNIHIGKSSGNGYLDKAALQAVANANMPPKPAELSGVDHFIVRVNFIAH